MRNSIIYIILFGLIFAFPEKKEPETCGNNSQSDLPLNAQKFAPPTENNRELQYDIELAFNVIYGEYASTDITLHLSINEYIEDAGFLTYDMFTKHWVMDDWAGFTEENQSIELTIPERVGPHYLRLYVPEANGAVSGYITDSANNILSSWSAEEFLQWQSETGGNSVYINFDTGEGDVPVGMVPQPEIEQAVERLNYRFANTSIQFTINSINYAHNNDWAIGMDLWDTWASVYELAINSTEILNIFSLIGFNYNLALGGVGISPWYLDSWEEEFYRVSMKSIYLTDLSADEGRDHVFDHEVGHSLGLLHTFNYGCDMNTHGDYVLDTPTHAGASNVCDYSFDSCPEDDGNDPVDNAMNYVYGSECQIGITRGQRERMLWAIDNWVPTLLNPAENTISVPEDFLTIQEAFDNANENATIHVSPETYYENLNWPNTSGLHLIANGPDSTIIDGSQNGRVITVDDEDSPPAEISGFKITNGYAPNYQGGGGIELIMVGDILLSNLKIVNNEAYHGGGIFVEGLGAYWNGQVHITLDHVEITNNHARNNGGGFSANGYVDLVSTLFKSVTIANNSAENPTGSGIIFSQGNYGVILNSIVWNNTPNNLMGMLFPYYSNIEGGSAFESVEVLDIDPLFVGDNDFRLQADSPCIDVGSPYIDVFLDPYHILPGDMWMNGIMVDLNPAYYGGIAPDMGAYEYPSSYQYVVLGDLNFDGYINVVDVIITVGIILGTFIPDTIELEAADLNGDGAINVVDVIQIVGLILDD